MTKQKFNIIVLAHTIVASFVSFMAVSCGQDNLTDASNTVAEPVITEQDLSDLKTNIDKILADSSSLKKQQQNTATEITSLNSDIAATKAILSDSSNFLAQISVATYVPEDKEPKDEKPKHKEPEYKQPKDKELKDEKPKHKQPEYKKFIAFLRYLYNYLKVKKSV